MSMFLITVTTNKEEGQQPLDTADKVTHKPKPPIFSVLCTLSCLWDDHRKSNSV